MYDLIGGRATWTALGLPTEGSLGDRRRIAHYVEPAGTVPFKGTVADIGQETISEETGPWRENTRIVGREEARDTIAQAKEGEGGTLLVFGSMTTWNGLLSAGLVDELHMMVGAGVLIGGVPAFSVQPPGPMQLTGARRLGDSNLALLLYALA